ncbi:MULTISPECIES: SLC13 family permease [unclassified Desulfovibrio]|uniref:SLC13 family permease n=1 Tax=unclassified Desulfovibrio TaxID=2593640 RepID=UPI000F5E4CFB|nr:MULTISPECIES: SLC13 family permease [unclassified Desulfovibrio]RRD70149.1 sodium:sulfate symporter [Desulfovibrio sp. OH1209_COT-279]RRD86681.1 sodium:sulfate symporter [Desulfovibrio sp. OH1186_COT-070]
MLKTSDFTPGMLATWAASLALPLAVHFFLPRSEVLTTPMIAFLAVTLWAIMAWSFNTLNEVAVGLLLPILYVLACGVGQKVAFSPWLSEVGIIVIGGFCLGKIIQATGLGQRIALTCVRLTGSSLAGALAGMTLGAALLAPLVPSIIGKGAIFCAVALSLCAALDFKPKSREATLIVLGTCLAVSSTKLGYLTGGADLVMGMGLVDKVTGGSTSWMEYAKFNCLPAMLYTLMSMGLALCVLRTPGGRADLRPVVQEKYVQLGPVTAEQKRALLLLGLTVLLLATDRWHHVSAGSVLMLITACAFLPGVGLLDGERISTVNFAPLFFIMGSMSIGAVGGDLKVTNWLADLVLPLFGNAGPTLATFYAYLIGVIADFVLTPLGAVSTLSAPVAELGLRMGMDPHHLYFAFQYGLDNILFPYEYALYLLFFSTGYIRFRDMLLVMALRMALAGPFVAWVALPYWRLVG